MGAEALLAPGGSVPYPIAGNTPSHLRLLRLTAATDLVGVGHREVGADQRVDELCEHLAAVCASAVDPLEIAAALEAEGLSDRSAHHWYGFSDVFALAEEMYRRVPRSPSEPPPVASPHQRQILRPMLHAALYGLPAVCFPAAAGVLAGPAALTVLVVSMLVSWAISQGLAYLGYLRLGWTQAGQARRLLRTGLAVGLTVLILVLAATMLVVPARLGAYAFGVGQGAYMLGACVLMVLGVERLLILVLSPGVVGACVYLARGRPPTLEPWLWVALATTPALAIVLALVVTRRIGPTMTGGIISASEVRRALPSVTFGLLAAALLAFPIVMSTPAGTDASIGAMLAAVPLSVSMGAAEWSMSWYRRTTQRLVRASSRLSGFSWHARLMLSGAVLQYLAVAVLLTGSVVVIVLESGLVRWSQSTVVGVLAYVALGGAMFVSLLLHAFGVCCVTVLACAAALAAEVAFREAGAVVPMAVYSGLFGFLWVYATVVLGRAVWHSY